jgi:hypothetical protein
LNTVDNIWQWKGIQEIGAEKEFSHLDTQVQVKIARVYENPKI